MNTVLTALGIGLTVAALLCALRDRFEREAEVLALIWAIVVLPVRVLEKVV